MRILFWNEFFAPSVGGVEIFTARLGKRLAERGHRIAVVAARHQRSLPDFEIVDGIEVHRLPFGEAVRRGVRDAAGERRMAGALAEIATRTAGIRRGFCPDVGLVNFAGAASYFYAKFMNIGSARTIVVFQAELGRQFAGNPVLKTLIDKAERLVAVSRPAAKNVTEMTDAPLDRIAIIPPGIAVEDYAETVRGENSGIPAFIFVGRLVPEKGADIAIEATIKARARRPLRLLVIGDGPERRKLQGLVAARRADDFIDLIGAIDDARKMALLADSFAALVPSRHFELFGMVAVEAGLAGLPVIAARRGGLTEVVKDRQTGLLVTPDDPDALAEAMLSLLGDPARAAQMGRAARAGAMANYNLEKTADLYEALLRQASPAR